MLSILTFIATFWETLIIKLNDESLSLFYIFPITVHYSLCFMLFIALMGFLIFHLYLIFSGYSTIEYCEKKTKRVTYVGKSPYNLSCFANLKEALGERWLLWLLPIKYRTDKEDGLQFTVNQPEIIEKEDSEI